MTETSKARTHPHPTASPALPLEAYGDRSRRVAVRLMWSLPTFVAALFAIAAIAPIYRVAVAQGAVSPDGSSLSVGHPEGGVVDEIIKRPGDVVVAGDVVLRLRPIGDFSRARHSDPVDTFDVRAPAGGRIQQVYPKTSGAVVRPGDVVFDLAPSDTELLAEVRLRPEDFGEVLQGASARITLTDDDLGLFGEVEGIVKSISPSPFQSEAGEVYHQVIVSLSRTHLQRKGEPFAVPPGMVVRAEIKLDERSLLRHILKPVDRAIERAIQ